ncbi:MAG: PilX N-terminal domain-containing pilus assembly protein [Gammaproteobacteria bacterium]
MKTLSFSARRQHGAALAIGLILLLILTVLGVSGLGTATTEVRLADNNKQREYAFQAAESAMRTTLLNGGLITIDGTELENDLVRDVVTNFTFDHNNAAGSMADAGVDVNVTTLYRGRGLPSSAACGQYDIARTSMVHMLIDSRATGARGATSVVRQGFCVPAPR